VKACCWSTGQSGLNRAVPARATGGGGSANGAPAGKLVSPPMPCVCNLAPIPSGVVLWWLMRAREGAGGRAGVVFLCVLARSLRVHPSGPCAPPAVERRSTLHVTGIKNSNGLQGRWWGNGAGKHRRGALTPTRSLTPGT